jgi:hypothetical protein
LTGLDVERVEAGLAEVANWKLPLVASEFVDRLDMDAIVGGVLLAESLDALQAQGVPRSKLMKKLRDAVHVNELWAVWAEIRAAAILIGYPGEDLRVEIEAPGTGAKRPDYRWILPDGSGLWLEFKAVGLSDPELDWHDRAAAQFDWLLPPAGLSTLHGCLTARLMVGMDKRNRAWRESERVAGQLAQELPGTGWDEVRGISVVGHQTEDTYLCRARSAIKTAVDQLPRDQESWVALWWGNGAPTQAAADLLDSVDAPENVTGIVFIGQSIAVPWSQISCFIVQVPRGAEIGAHEMRSSVHAGLARRVMERYESSAGVRPTLLQTPSGQDLLRRDGNRRLFPFNLLFDADPRKLAAPHRPPSPVQDVALLD